MIPDILDSLSFVVSSTKGYEPEKMCLIFEKGGNTPLKLKNFLNENFSIGFSVSEPHRRDLKLLSKEMWNCVYFARTNISDTRFVFFPMVIISTKWS